jgi:hypothetical protein
VDVRLDPLRTLGRFAKRQEVDRAGAAMSGFMQAIIGLAIAAIAFALATLEVAVDLKTLLIGLFLMLMSAIALAVRTMARPISRFTVVANASIIAAMIVSFAANYLLQLDFRLLHLFGLWVVLFVAGHIILRDTSVKPLGQLTSASQTKQTLPTLVFAHPPW